MKIARRHILFLTVGGLAFVASVLAAYLFTYRLTPASEVEAGRLEHALVEKTPVEAPEIPLNQDVRKIDFENFTYHWFPKNENVFKKRIVLRNGQNGKIHLEGEKYGPLGEDYQESLSNVSYADLTGDGKEEAIVTVGVEFYRWRPECIFVFAEKNKKAVQLWKYETSTWDNNLVIFRGLRIEAGRLVIEEYKEGMATCCAESYSRRKFAWNGKTFAQTSVETFPFYNRTKEYKGYPSEPY